MNKIGGIGILGILLFAAFFSCGCIDTAPTETIEVEKIVYVDRIVEVDNYDIGYSDGWNDMVIEYNKDMKDNEQQWKTLIENRDKQWGKNTVNAYNQGWNDACDNTITDVVYIVKEVTPVLKWLPI